MLRADHCPESLTECCASECDREASLMFVTEREI